MNFVWVLILVALIGIGFGASAMSLYYNSRIEYLETVLEVRKSGKI